MNENKNLTKEETFALALENHRKNDLQVATNLYNEVLKMDPNYADAHCNLGVIVHSLGESQKAISYFEKTIQIDPNHVDAYNNLRIIFFKLGEFESSYNNHIKFLQLKSEGTVSNAKLENVIPKLAKKLLHQNGIPTFFDNAVHSQLTKKNNPTSDYCDVFEKGQLSKENRFISYPERVKGFSKSVPTSRLFHGLPFLVSQGVHSLIKWKEIPLYKTAFDLTIYSMILQEVKPDVIIELGSGSGGRPTANSVITDIVDLANRESSKQINNYFNSIASKMKSQNINNNIIFDNYSLYYYVRLLVSNSPGVLYNITKILSKNKINVSNAIQSEKSEIGKETPLILTLETRDQKSIDKAMNELNQMPIVKKSIKIMILE